MVRTQKPQPRAHSLTLKKNYGYNQYFRNSKTSWPNNSWTGIWIQHINKNEKKFPQEKNMTIKEMNMQDCLNLLH